MTDSNGPKDNSQNNFKDNSQD
ncbi:MAG: hypothetical protein JWR73_3309, partial [Tardiphaga sp.]|nr:hypothetical protein [Tardiphaga sp.]